MMNLGTAFRGGSGFHFPGQFSIFLYSWYYSRVQLVYHFKALNVSLES